MPKEIKGDLVHLKPYTLEHITSRTVEWLNDSELMKYSENRHKTFSLKSCQDYFNSFDHTNNRWFAIHCSQTNLHLGNIICYLNTYNKVADISILIGEQEKRVKGIGQNAWELAMNYLLDDLGMRKVTGGTVSLNKAMLKIFKNTGMVSDGIRRAHYLIEGCEVDIEYFAKFKKIS